MVHGFHEWSHVIRKWFDGGDPVTRSLCESTGGQVGVIGRSVRSWWEIVSKCNGPHCWNGTFLLVGPVVFVGWSVRTSTKPMWKGVLEGFGLELV
jgi:hypothetical protein